MDVFKDYAEMYDLFYRDKDYSAECRYVIDLINKYSDRPVRALLDIGCGTGGHALIWAQDGLNVTGMDRSPAMLAHARKKAEKLKLTLPFLEGDVRDFDLGRKFDDATAMFAVMSYQTETEEILSALHSVRQHLEPGGLFLFDVWSGPGVMSDPPGDRVSYFERGETEIIRTVCANHDVNRQVVTVHYDILCIQGERVVQRVREAHPMRYFFPREVADYAGRTGFEVVTCEPFMKQGDALRVKDWNITVIARAI